MAETTELTVTLPVYLLDDVEDLISETGYHADLRDFVVDALRGMLFDVLQGFDGELSNRFHSYLTLRESFPDARRVTVEVPTGLSETLTSYLDGSDCDLNQFAGIAVDRLCMTVDSVYDEFVCGTDETD